LKLTETIFWQQYVTNITKTAILDVYTVAIIEMISQYTTHLKSISFTYK